MNATSLAPESDYAIVSAPREVRLQRVLPGSIERVWRHLTESELRRQWLAAGDMALRVGAPFTLTWRNDELGAQPGQRPDGFGAEHSMHSRITALDPPHRLAFAWADGEVSFELQPQGEQVLLTLVHRGVSDRHNMVMVGAGWHVHLDILGERLRGVESAPFWDRWSALREQYAQRIPA